MDLRRVRCYYLIGVFIVFCTIQSIATKTQDVPKTQAHCGAENKSESGSDLFCKQLTGKAACLLGRQLRDISRDELGLTALDEILDKLHSSPRVITDGDLVLTISEKLLHKINVTSQMLLEIRDNILSDTEVRSFTYPCLAGSYRSAHRLDNIEINSEKVTLNIPKNSGKVYVKNITKKYKLKFESLYFMAIKDGGTDEQCGAESSHGAGRALLHSTLQPQSKRVVLLLEAGSAVPPEELRAAAALAGELLNLLRSSDTVAVIFLAHQARVAHLSENCSDEAATFGFATEHNKEIIYKHLHNAETSHEAANVTAGFELALDILGENNNEENSSIVYIGKKTSLLLEWKNIKKMISMHTKKNGQNITLAGCNVQVEPDIGNSSVVVGISDPKQPELDHPCVNWMLDLNSCMSVGQMASLMLLRLPTIGEHRGAQMGAAPPTWEPKQKHSAASFLLPFYIPVHRLGLLVVELYFSDISEDIIYFNSFSPRHRAFILDFSGNVIVHSMYPRPELVVTKPRLVDISYLEVSEYFDNVRFYIFNNRGGNMTFSNITYTWKWVGNVYIVCVVSENDNGSTTAGARLYNGVARELQHHRMDLLPPPNTPLCRHFLMVSTIHKGTLYLSPSSFQSPFSYLFELNNGKDVSLKLMQSYMAFLKDTTRLLSNPGLKTDVRSDVGILNLMLSYFKRQHIRGAYNKYIVRRYAVSDHGVLVLFPGTILESDFEPNRKAWFLRAMGDPGRIILTPPYLDIGGAGYIVTVSQAPIATNDKSKPAIVLSVDMTMRYLYKMLLDTLPLCTETNIRCFLMDDRGYLLTHPGLVDPPNSGPIEQTHITREESLVANDMLNHKGFVQKKLCKNYADSTLQRYYQFNTSLDRILTYLVHGDHCARYHIAAIPGTNAFVGLVNSSCREDAFCPCSVVDRVCLNCYRMEQNECECPCECVMSEEDTCSSTPPAVPLCPFESERNHRNNFYTRRYNLAPHLDSCFDFQCESYNSKSSCLGVLGCEWCEIDRDGESLLTIPFCTAQPTCFGGVLGSATPYEVGSFGQVTQDDLSPAYSAVGPIVGCIVALCLILALAVYCYKQNLTSDENMEPFPALPDAWPHAGLQMNHLNSEDDVHDERSGHQDKLILANEAVPPISPYRILTGYRRPNTAGESDHGYSTMTPHDDSEHQAFALVEPFLAQEGAGGAASSPALSTPRSSATDLPLTMLPCGKNNIIAPVTVHRHMEAT